MILSSIMKSSQRILQCVVQESFNMEDYDSVVALDKESGDHQKQ